MQNCELKIMNFINRVFLAVLEKTHLIVHSHLINIFFYLSIFYLPKIFYLPLLKWPPSLLYFRERINPLAIIQYMFIFTRFPMKIQNKGRVESVTSSHFCVTLERHRRFFLPNVVLVCPFLGVLLVLSRSWILNLLFFNLSFTKL